MSIALGTRLGPYEIVGVLGAGGMGEVYRARDHRLERFVAVKVLSPHLAAQPELLERFQREARAVAALNHPNICTVHDVDTGADPPYIAMELLEGETLHARLFRGPLPLAEVIEIGAALADALDAAHATGIVHRDIKPANIMLTRRGPKILDFGLAKAAASAAPPASDAATRQRDAQLTSMGATVGTLAYMSPEQLRGEPLDARSDLFSFGLVLYEMVTGRPAFSGATSAVISAAILHEAPVAPRVYCPELPARLEDTILKALEKDRTLRCQTALELRADLKRFARASASANAAAAPIGRHRFGLVAAAVMLAALVAAAVAFVPWAGRDDGPSEALSSSAPAAALSATASMAASTEDGSKSIAVLPFANLSADPDQEYFADGISEELLNALARIPDLQVAGRTSSFAFKGNEDLRTIGERLGVQHLLTGSVRKAGDRVRIAAQLIDAATGRQLWADSYERLFENIFDIQDEIAASVTNRLEVALGLGINAVPGMTRNVAAYDEFLRAREIFLRFDPALFPAGIEHARRAIAIDPAFSVARLVLYHLYDGTAQVSASTPAMAEDLIRRRTEVLEEALALTPESPAVQAYVAYDEVNRGNILPGGALLQEWPQGALGRMVPTAPHIGGFILLHAGRAAAAIDELERVRVLDPLHPTVAVYLGVAYVAAGNRSAALAELDRGRRFGQAEEVFWGESFLAALAARDRPEIDRLLALIPEAGFTTSFINRPLGNFLDDPVAGQAEIRRLAGMPASQSPIGYSILAYWAAYYGNPELALEYLEKVENAVQLLVWRPVLRDVWKLPGFKDLVRRMGLVDYWRAYGWADFCRPTTGDDFECE